MLAMRQRISVRLQSSALPRMPSTYSGVTIIVGAGALRSRLVESSSAVCCRRTGGRRPHLPKGLSWVGRCMRRCRLLTAQQAVPGKSWSRASRWESSRSRWGAPMGRLAMPQASVAQKVASAGSGRDVPLHRRSSTCARSDEADSCTPLRTRCKFERANCTDVIQISKYVFSAIKSRLLRSHRSHLTHAAAREQGNCG